MGLALWWFLVKGDRIHNHAQVQGPFPDVAMCRLTNLQFQYWIGQGVTEVWPCTATQPTIAPATEPPQSAPAPRE